MRSALFPPCASAIAMFAEIIDLPSDGFAEDTANIFLSDVAREKFTFVLIDLYLSTI